MSGVAECVLYSWAWLYAWSVGGSAVSGQPHTPPVALCCQQRLFWSDATACINDDEYVRHAKSDVA